MSAKEEQRLQVLNLVLEKRCTVGEAASLTGVSERHLWRLLAAYRRQGARALVHGNRGRKPVHATPEEVRQRVEELARGRYAACNYQHLTELLEEREGLRLSHGSVWRILTAAGLPSPRRRRPPQHRCRRERYPQEGMLLQVDGSRHDWLQGRGPWLTLLCAVDDATGTVPYALFREQEDAQGYFLLLQGVLDHKGIPLALYSDRHSIFTVNPPRPLSLEEELAGGPSATQVGRALEQLGIRLILARSPQAKGRVERLFGTLQDRLVQELALAGARTMKEANAVLWAYLPGFNARFGVPAAQPGSAYQPVPEALDLEGLLCFHYERVVAVDNTVRFGRQTLQVLPDRDRLSYARARVLVQERVDGTWWCSIRARPWSPGRRLRLPPSSGPGRGPGRRWRFLPHDSGAR